MPYKVERQRLKKNSSPVSENVKKIYIADSGIPIWAIYKREISLCFKLLGLFEFVTVYGVRVYSNFIDLHAAVQLY